MVRRIHRIACLGALLLSAPLASAQEWEVDWERVQDIGQAVADFLSDYELDPDVVSPPSLEEWRGFWLAIEKGLTSESPEAMAWMLPEAEDALAWLDQQPSARPYADWLRQRLDYFTMANEALLEDPSRPGPLRPPSAIGARRPHVAAPPPGPVIRVIKPVGRTAIHARDAAMWQKKLAGRPLPAGAKDLIPGLKAVFREEGLPPELVWIAEVESTLDPRARSPAGAAGLFQLMPATARRLGLSTFPRDERYQPDKCARAAAQYLRYLHGRFGDWPLTLAAYNAGEGTVGRLQKEKKAATFDALVPHLPLQTQMYVPKISATVALREGAELAKLPGPVQKKS